MSLLYKQEEQSQMLPAVWPARDTVPGSSGYQDGPHHQSVGEVEAQQKHHKFAARIKMARLFQQYRDHLISNKYHVTVTSDIVSTEEKICLTVYENKKVIHFTVKNSGVTAVYLTFWSAVLVKNIFTVRDCHGNNVKTIRKHTLRPGEAYEIKVHFHSLHAGFYEQLLVFNFETCQQFSDTFEIMRLLEVVHLTSLSDEPSQKATHSLCQTVLWNPKKGRNLLKHVIPLKKYGMPSGLKYSKEDVDLLGPVTWENYSQRFHKLLHLEELQQKRDIEKYNQDDVPLFAYKGTTDLVIMQIAGVFKRSALKSSGVCVIVVPLTKYGVERYYTGWLQHVEAEYLYLQFDKEFQSLFKEGMRVRAFFAINRIGLRHQHRAAALVHEHSLKEVLFPTGQHSLQCSHSCSLSGIEGNPEQCTAVNYIVAGTAKPAPYLVFGPPGTGKTVTLVEAIKHIVKTQNSCHILACAPSNSAADHLCEKMVEKNIQRVFRLYALSFPLRKIPPKIQPHCNLNITKTKIVIPPKDVLLRYKVMVTTLITAGRLVTGGIHPGHFNYIFVDEAGQARETECIIPLAGLMKLHTCQVVLAGDPKQLGPVITSRTAETNGLGLSLLERLMDNMDIYKSDSTDGFNNCFITKLLRNYRSHPEILKIPNELFYKGELQAYADKKKCSSFCKWEHLPKKGFPLIFHGVAGADECDANSPSVYNMAEVEVIKEYLKALIDHFHKNDMATIEPSEIGIIAPYRKQVEKIQNALKTDKDLKKENLENILIGSVENFQGKEFNVILLSTVRSTPKLSAYKQDFTLGFVDNGKRFNVALTRAQSLLIVIGDPRVLKTDKMWKKFINYCYKEGGYRGIAVSDAEEEKDTLNNVHSQNLWHHMGEQQQDSC